MSIRFRCKCGQKLRVGDEKAGQRAKCPRCKSLILVPAASDPTEEASSNLHEPPSPEPSSRGPIQVNIDPEPTASPAIESAASFLPEIVIRDDSDVWTYEKPLASPEQGETVIDYDKVAVPRKVLYFQGILLGVVALVSFVLGMLMAEKGPRDQAQRNSEPCVLAGEVTYRINDEGRPDDGSVVIVLPADRRPNADGRVEIEGLRPDDPRPADENISLRTIRALGGDYARTNEQGAFQFRLPSGGQYHVLVISRRAARSPSDRMEMTDVAQIGRYFSNVTDLILDRKYQWQTLTLRRDERIEANF